MAVKNKKVAAALAAVGLYLQQEEAALAEQQRQVISLPASDRFSAWAHSGRQEMMAMRRLIQIRTFTRF